MWHSTSIFVNFLNDIPMCLGNLITSPLAPHILTGMDTPTQPLCSLLKSAHLLVNLPRDKANVQSKEAMVLTIDSTSVPQPRLAETARGVFHGFGFMVYSKASNHNTGWLVDTHYAKPNGQLQWISRISIVDKLPG